MWIWACWSYPAQESPWCWLGCTAYITAGGLFIVNEIKKEEEVEENFYVHEGHVGDKHNRGSIAREKFYFLFFSNKSKIFFIYFHDTN